LKPAIDGLEPLQRVQKLKGDVSHLIRARCELLGVLDGKPDAVDSNTGLVRHLEFHWSGLVVRPRLNQFKDLFSEFVFHICCPAIQKIPVAGPMAFAAQTEFYGHSRLAPKTPPDASERRQTISAEPCPGCRWRATSNRRSPQARDGCTARFC
jgi:hypothetical protein